MDTLANKLSLIQHQGRAVTAGEQQYFPKMFFERISDMLFLEDSSMDQDSLPVTFNTLNMTTESSF
jgi:hypothetical protein